MSSAEWDARYGASADLVWSAAPNRFVVAEAAELPAGRALDLGAGEGRNAVWLAARGWAVTAVDFSSVALDRGRRLAAEQGVGVGWELADVREYLPPPHAFDLVVIAYLHLRPADRAVLLRRAAGAVAPGGVLLVVAHDLANLAEGVGGPQDPAVLYAPEVVAGALGGEWEVRRAETAPRPVEGQPVAALDTVVVARRRDIN